MTHRIISVGARGSPLSRIQCEEVETELRLHHPEITFVPTWVTTTGDIDKTTALSDVTQEDFFTKEIDELQITRKIRISIHSAKDLPTPLKPELRLVALTKGIDSRDVLILRQNMTPDMLTKKHRIGISSKRRKEALHHINCSPIAVEIRGTIQERLQLIDNNIVDGLIMAEAALIRLNLTHLNRFFIESTSLDPLNLQTSSHPLQGKLAVIARYDDVEMADLFRSIDSRQNTLSGM